MDVTRTGVLKLVTYIFKHFIYGHLILFSSSMRFVLRKMWMKATLFLCLYSVSLQRGVSSKHTREFGEDFDAFVKFNTSMPTTTGRTAKPEVVVEKFVETLIASERYLKLIEVVEDKMGHLQTIFRERTNTVMKYLTEILRVIKTSPVDQVQSNLHSLKDDLEKLKKYVSQQSDDDLNLRGKYICINYFDLPSQYYIFPLITILII